MKRVVILLVVATLVLGGCAGMSNTQQRVVSGGAIGASGGALIGWAAGAPPGCWAVFSTISTRNLKDVPELSCPPVLAGPGGDSQSNFAGSF
jgi:hypothetical protein